MGTFLTRSGHDAPPQSDFTSAVRRRQARPRPIRLIGAAVLILHAGAASAGQREDPAAKLAEVLRSTGARLERWFSRAQTVISTEAVSIQPLGPDMAPDEPPRRLMFELRLAWDPDRLGPFGVSDVAVLRQLLTVNGRSPRTSDARDPGCMDPKSVSAEPLTMLLPARLPESRFSLAGETRVRGRAALMIDYQGGGTREPDIVWTRDCVTVSLPGRSRGRVWLDAESYDVLRVDDRLTTRFEFDVPREFVRRGAAPSMIIERADSSVRYARVEFDEPRETIMLPESVDTVTVIRGTATQRVRIIHRLSNHRRFLTDSRLVY